MSTTTAVFVAEAGARPPSAFFDWLRAVTDRAASNTATDADEETDGEDLLRRLREAGL